MSMCKAIRDLMPNLESAKSVRNVIDALPQYKAQRIRESIGMMFNANPPILNRTGNRSDGFAYYVVRQVQIRAYPTEEARKAATRERELLRNRRRRGGGSLVELRQRQAEARAAKAALPKPPRAPKRPRTPIAEVRAQQQQARERKAAARIENARLRQQQFAAEKKATQEAIEAKRELWRKRKAEQRAKTRLSPAQRILAHSPAVARAPRPRTELAPTNGPRETVEEWMRRTGKEPEKLPPTVCAEPLLRIALR